MRRSAAYAVSALFLVACSGADSSMPTNDAGDAASGLPEVDAALTDGAGPAGDAGSLPECEWGGAPGTCLTLSACAAITDHSSEPGSCPGPATIQCCIDTPNVADNPSIPAGYMLMMQAQVTPAMTTWAVMILHDPVTYPMYATTTQTFGTLMVLARVEWHPPDFQNSVVHRGVTLYVPL